MYRASPSPVLLMVGLTGGICSGKSVVDRMLADLGAHVIDADRIVHRLLESDTDTIGEIGAAFGSGVLASRGGVDRHALGRIVFVDSEMRDVLNKILHPKVRLALDREVDSLRGRGQESVVVVDAALLVESGYYREFDRLVVVTTSAETQLQRLMKRDGYSREEALARIAAQWPTEAKLAVADYRIDNDGTLEKTRAQVRKLYDRLLEDLRQKARDGSLGEPPPEAKAPPEV